VPELSAIEVEMDIEKVQRHKSLGLDQILGELITEGGRIINSVIHIFINSISNNEQLPEEWNSRL
jgi:hypothetical protein